MTKEKIHHIFKKDKQWINIFTSQGIKNVKFTFVDTDNPKLDYVEYVKSIMEADAKLLKDDSEPECDFEYFLCKP
jgi:1-acyl-sn-glycerol-3-phosphate acyltransferase